MWLLLLVHAQRHARTHRWAACKQLLGFVLDHEMVVFFNVIQSLLALNKRLDALGRIHNNARACCLLVNHKRQGKRWKRKQGGRGYGRMHGRLTLMRRKKHAAASSPAFLFVSSWPANFYYYLHGSTHMDTCAKLHRDYNTLANYFILSCTR